MITKNKNKKTCHEYTEHKNQLQQNGGRQDLRDLGEIRGLLGMLPLLWTTKESALWKDDRTSRMTRQMILIPVTSAGSEVTFLRISGRSVAIPHPLPPHTLPASLAGFVLHCLWFLSWSTADSPFFVRAALPCLPIGILINFYAVIGFFFLPHLHCLVLHHVEGNYTFIYYIASNIKPRKLYQRQQLFNHPSRETRFQRQSPFGILKVITHSRKPISKASFICGYC